MLGKRRAAKFSVHTTSETCKKDKKVLMNQESSLNRLTSGRENFLL